MSTDVLILGAGPAGIALSMLMARKGFAVEILDAAYFPRTKICGEFLNPQAVGWLCEQDLLGEVERMNPYPIRGMQISDHSGRTFRGTYKNSLGYAIQRKDFDALLVSLLERDGVQLHQGFRADRILFDGNRARGVTGTNSAGERIEKNARVVIGADGRNNLVGRTFGWMKAIRNFRKYAFLTYFENVSGLQNYGEIHLVRNGYVGVAPLRSDLANVALVIDEKSCPSGATDLKEFLLSNLEETSLMARLRNPVPLCPVITAGPLAFTVKRQSGFGTLLVGDTCGFLDPFTGEGINYAFVSATIAASVLQECFEKNQFEDEALNQYDRKRKEALSKKFQIARMLQMAVHSHGLSGFLIRRFAERQSLADTMVSAVGNAIDVKEVWNAAFLFDVVFGKR